LTVNEPTREKEILTDAGGLIMDAILIRAEEAAKLLGVGRSKIYSMMASGGLPVVRLGRSVRVPIEGLREWIAQQTRSSQARGVTDEFAFAPRRGKRQRTSPQG